MGYESLKVLLGKQVTAIGDCGMAKDVRVYGTLTEVEGSNALVTIKRGQSLQDCSVNPTTIKVVTITNQNLDEKTLTNREVIELLSNLSLAVYRESFGKVLDVIEDLTGNRDFEL